MMEHGLLSQAEFDELDSFLDLNLDQGGMDIFMLDGYLCALACGPNRLDPADWLPHIWGVDGAEPCAESSERLPHIVALLMRYLDATAEETAAGTFEPLLPESALSHTDSRAETWCVGFMLAVSLDGAWKKFLSREDSVMLAMPIFVLADLRRFMDDPVSNPGAIEGLVMSLPLAVGSIRLYWRTEKAPVTRRRALGRGNDRSPAVAGPGTVHRLKIRLLDVKPSVWRRLEIASDTQLPEVSRALLTVMGWSDSHLHAFHANGKSYAAPESGLMGDDLDERRVTIAQLVPQPKDHFLFEYDFGDGWEHRVTVEAIAATDPDVIYPRCLAGARACPPENCGGPLGYIELMRQLRDPSDDEHEAMLEWVGPIDPDAFSVNAVNDDLGTFAQRQRKAKREKHGNSKTQTQSSNGIMSKGEAKKKAKSKASEPDAVAIPRQCELWADA
jgi:yecA family protein